MRNVDRKNHIWFSRFGMHSIRSFSENVQEFIENAPRRKSGHFDMRFTHSKEADAVMRRFERKECKGMAFNSSVQCAVRGHSADA